MNKVFLTPMVIVLVVFMTVFTYGQESKMQTVAGVELQVYPTGVIPGVRYEVPISDRALLHLRAGYQFIDHRDLGKHDDETGSGYGFSLGYKRYLNAVQTKWSFMFKTDVWFNSIDWEGTETDGSATGSTDIVVLQPTVQAEYDFMISERLALSPSVAFGLEWNVKTEGSPTGEGPILLVGVALGYRL